MFEGDPDKIFEYMRKNTSSETDKVSFKSAIIDPRYRRGTLVAMICALVLFTNGIYPISSYGGRLFQKMYEGGDKSWTANLTLNTIAIADPTS